jgi:hypothetical protein
MGTANRPATRADLDQLADTRLPRGTREHREYIAALETEERFASHIWRRLQANSPPVSPTPTGD